MQKVLYLILFLMPVLLEAQNRANVQDRLLLPKTLRRAANELEDIEACAAAYFENVKPIMEETRTYCDRLEYFFEDSAWPLPKYREMFYIR